EVEAAVEVEDVGLRGCGLADAQAGAVVGWQDDGADLVALEGVAHSRPRGMDALVEQSPLDGDQQMVGEHAEKDVGFGAALGVMEDRPLGERRFHIAEGVLDTPYKLPLICCQDSANRRDSDSKRFAPSRAGLDRVMSKPLSASVGETLSPQRRRGVVLLLAQLARRRIQSPSSVEETVDHGRESRAAAGRLHAREDYATASRAPGDHLHSPVDASAG